MKKCGWHPLLKLVLVVCLGVGFLREAQADIYLPLVIKQPLPVVSGPIIVDHTCTDIGKIPDYWLEKAKLLTLHYGHTSHGSQINSGLVWLESLNAKYSVAIRSSGSTAGLPPQENPPAFRIYDGNPPESYIEPGDYWDGTSGLNRTRAVAATGEYNFSMWSWCGQQSSNSVATVQRYLDNLHQLENEYPGMRFIYMTGHTDGGSATLARNNELVRQYARNQGKILFDFADIESFDPSDGGPYVNNSEGSCTWCDDWCGAHPDFCASLPSSCAHSSNTTAQRLFCKLKGQAFWWLLARLAGWDGGTP